MPVAAGLSLVLRVSLLLWSADLPEGDAAAASALAAVDVSGLASPAGKSADPGKSETRSTSDKPAASGTTTGGS